jgi:hypothetical protein
LVCFKNVSKVGMASLGKWSLRVRIGGSPGKTPTKIHRGIWPVDPLIGTKSFRLKFPWSC